MEKSSKMFTMDMGFIVQNQVHTMRDIGGMEKLKEKAQV